jgi:hypothetical protein
MSFRYLDNLLLRRFGRRYLPAIWLRSFIYSRRRVQTIGPISQADRKYDQLFIEPSRAIVEALRQKEELPSYFNGCNYEGADLELFDYFISTYRPARIIEVGSGGSTQFAFWRTRGASTIICIDPEPRTVLPRATAITHIARRVEEVDVSIFQRLSSGDILFIDSSHSGKEAAYHIDRILPTLSSGVLVHHHDVYYPFDIQPGWHEQKILLDYYWSTQHSWEILCSAAFAYWYDHWFFRTRSLSSKLHHNSVPSSLWVRKR